MNLPAVEAAVRDHLGIDPGSLGPTVVLRAIDARLRATHSASLETYLPLLLTPAEVNALAAELAVHETWFFRGGRRLFDGLADFLIRRSARAAGRAVRALSIPCSTGEEPYSLAIALHERMMPPGSYLIDGVDIAVPHLDRARAGRFPDPSFREPGPDPRPLHFRPAADGWDLLPHLRPLVTFRQGNLTDPAFLVGEPPYDLVLCRNLFIYLTADGRKRAVAHLDRLLAADGRLCLSPAEADRLPAGRFTPDGPAEFCVYRRAEWKPTESGVRVVPSRAPANPAPPTAHARRPLTSPPPVPVAPPPVADAPAFGTARALADAGRLSEARVVCERACAAHPDSADGYALLGAICQAEGNAAAAGDAFRKALYLSPDHPDALTHLVLLADRRGDTDQAAALRRRLARLSVRGGNL